MKSHRISRWDSFCSRRGLHALAVALVLLAGAVAVSAQHAPFGGDDSFFHRGNLVVSRSVYDDNPASVAAGTILPPNCAATTAGCAGPGGAPYDGSYPLVWNNDNYDSSFGITSKIYLDEMSPSGWVLNSLEVPNSSQRHVSTTSDQLVTSFSSKSELALHLSTDGKYLTFLGYVAPIDAIDVSNANTPDAPDPTNPVGINALRAIAMVDAHGRFQFTETQAYSGNNGRAAILNNSSGANFIYTAGNAGNGSNPQPYGIDIGAGAQIIVPSSQPESAQTPGDPAPVASFSVTQIGAKADKIGKDDNFRGITIFNNVLYLTKGSGSNGVNTVYFVDTTGTACPGGIGLPAGGATLPTTPLTFTMAGVLKNGLPNNMCILAGFPAVANKSLPSGTAAATPFGLWFADANTIYLAEEGDGYNGGADLYTHAAAQTDAGLQKWVFDSTRNEWTLAYVLQTGLQLGIPYNVWGYPAGNNPGTNLPWSPATDGLRNLTGRVGRDGDEATIYAVTSTVSGNGDVGADPNRLVVIRDRISNTDPAVAALESFFTLRTARAKEVLRGVEFAPSSDSGRGHQGGDDRH